MDEFAHNFNPVKSSKNPTGSVIVIRVLSEQMALYVWVLDCRLDRMSITKMNLSFFNHSLQSIDQHCDDIMCNVNPGLSWWLTVSVVVSCQLCYLYADMHKQTSSKESRRFFMEFHSLFLDRSAVCFSLQSSSCLWSHVVLHTWYISRCSSRSVSGSRTLKCHCQRRLQPSWVSQKHLHHQNQKTLMIPGRNCFCYRCSVQSRNKNTAWMKTRDKDLNKILKQIIIE